MLDFNVLMDRFGFFAIKNVFIKNLSYLGVIDNIK